MGKALDGSLGPGVGHLDRFGASNDPHQALQPLVEAARLATAKIAVLPVPMHWECRRCLGRPIESVAKAFAFMPAYFRVVGQLWRLRDHDLIVVREFLTTLLLVVWPLIWPLRRRACFLINHNLQEAHRRGRERWILRLLYWSGCRFACFETAAGFAGIGIEPDAERVLILPHPIGSLESTPDRPGRDRPVVGVIGEVRAEKGAAEVLDALLELRRQGRLDAHLVLGCPDAAVRAVWQERGFEVLDTAAPADYAAALGRCDVVVLNYQRERYFYRPSGAIADAVAHGAAVVTPDFPLMRRQLSHPAAVGSVFADLEQLPDAIARALALRPSFADALARQVEARDAVALAGLLDGLAQRALAARRMPRIGARRATPRGKSTTGRSSWWSGSHHIHRGPTGM